MVADEEGPLAVVLDVEVVVDGDLGVLLGVRLRQRHHERLVLVRREVVAGEEVEHDLPRGEVRIYIKDRLRDPVL